MTNNKQTSVLIDGILRATAAAGVLSLAVIAPNAVQILDKPLKKLTKHLDENAQLRENQRVLRYMIRQGLIKGDYEHGLQLTDKGRGRLAKSSSHIKINKPSKWDSRWRIILYDIPETHRVGRNALSSQLRELGFWQLQRSVWVFPYPCREEIELITVRYKIDQFVTYLESDFIDNQKALIDKFKAKKLM